MRILIVHADAGAAVTYRALLESEHVVAVAHTAAEALEAAAAAPPALALVHVTNIAGVDAARALSDRGVAVVLISPLNDFPVGRGLSDIASLRCLLHEPCGRETMLRTINDAIAQPAPARLD